MTPALLFRVLRNRARLAEHDAWPRARLLAARSAALSRLRVFAASRSSYWREVLADTEGAPLERLPILTKAELMARWDDIVTDPDLRLADAQAHVAEMAAGALFRGRWYVSATSGTSGTRGVFAWEPSEWAWILASYARAQDWAGVGVSLAKRRRMAVVSSKAPWHQSALVGATVDSPWIPTLRLDAAAPLAETCAALDAFQPETLVLYASMARVLAEEQLGGRLRIRPRAVFCASEVLTGATRARARDAWGSEPFEVYAATEPAGIASECLAHRMHLYEDLVIPEFVDEGGRAVPPGTFGARTLVTVLFSRTLPLLRYELDDRVRPSAEPCGCGRPYATIDGIEGRADEVLELPAAAGGTLAIHPVLFHQVLEPVSAHGWQVVANGDAITVLVAHPVAPFDPRALAAALCRRLREAGVLAPAVRVETVDAIPRGATAKARQVRRA
ncbi:MAG: phenylacetate--CoA ligase family protein [Myxococcota bacterium]